MAMTESPGGTVTLTAEDAMWLVVGHLNYLTFPLPDPDDPEDPGPGGEDLDGCCARCCGPCGTLKRLLDTGQLDDIARPYRDGWLWWDKTRDQVHRAGLAAVWAAEKCGLHDGEESAGGC